MGSTSSKGNATTNFKYKNGKPTVQGTEVYPMFNYTVFRIADSDGSRWAFYNDTRDLIVHVAILFDYDSQIEPLGDTTAFRIDDPEEGMEDDFGKYLCEVDVQPGQTQLFVSGNITGWRIDTLESRTSADEREYRL